MLNLLDFLLEALLLEVGRSHAWECGGNREVGEDGLETFCQFGELIGILGSSFPMTMPLVK